MTREEFYDYALTYYGLPYIWGGEFSPPHSGGDCSGLCQKLLAPIGLDPKGDQTAHTLYDHFVKNGDRKAGFGALAFFGKKERVHHVGFCLDHKVMLNASGGGSHVRTIDTASRLHAQVKIEPIRRRLDLLDILMPRYQWS